MPESQLIQPLVLLFQDRPVLSLAKRTVTVTVVAPDARTPGVTTRHNRPVGDLSPWDGRVSC